MAHAGQGQPPTEIFTYIATCTSNEQQVEQGAFTGIAKINMAAAATEPAKELHHSSAGGGPSYGGESFFVAKKGEDTQQGIIHQPVT
jgi:hypothetical protein